MNAERWAQLKPLFHGALDRDQAERATWLREACGDDVALRAEVDALLQSHGTLGGFLDQPAEIDPEDLAQATLPNDDAPADAGWVPGERVGEYDIVGTIGRGGMGVVYLATDRRLGRRVALKSLPTAVSAHPELRARLTREARAAATIADPAVATVYSLEEVDGHLLLASEYVSGPSLRELIDQGPVPADTARAIALDIARGLRAAHAAGVVHRDLKPENVLIATGGRAKLVDFGIAQLESSGRTRLTAEGALLGTPAYMAPEQLLGERADARTDIYALGVILTEMLSGRHPLSPAPPHDLAGHAPQESLLREPAAAQLLRVAEQCRQKDPSRRIPSALDAIALLESLEPRSAPGLAQPVPPAPTLHAMSAATAAPSRWWWEFHQGATAVSYAVILVPAWFARAAIGGVEGRGFFIATACAALVASMLRLHLWFTSRQHPAELAWARRRAASWIRVADSLFVLSLLIGAVLAGERSMLDVVLLVLAIGAAAAFVMIEPVTARAAGIDRTS